jgi:PAS domain S-box-containing protein
VELSDGARRAQPAGSDASQAHFTESGLAHGDAPDGPPRESELLAGVLSTSLDAIVFLLPTGAVSEWSGAAERLFGWTRAEMVGRHFSALVPPEWGAHARQLLSESEEHGHIRTLMTGVRKDGHRFYAEASSLPVRASDGRLTAFVTVVRDVSESVLATAAASIACSEETISSALDTVARAMRVVVPFDRLTLCSVDDDTLRRLGSSGLGAEPGVADAVHPLAGTPHEEAVRTRRTVVVGDTAAQSFDQMRRADDVGSYVVLPLFHDGAVVGTLDITFTASGQATRSTLVALDRIASAVTPAVVNMIAFDRQAVALRRLKRLDELKNDFLALITHDMRTPLAVIGACAETLRDRWNDLLEAEKLESVNAILRNERNLFRLVEEGLEVAMIESGYFGYEMASLDVGGQLTRTVEDILAHDQSRRIFLTVDPGLPFVHADRYRHWQVITNLLSNAIKFSPPESFIEVRATCEDGMVQVAVGDRGIGIRPEDVPLLFRKGSRVGPGKAGAVRGAGLGLFICKAIVEAHGGRIWVETTPGEGSTFTYTLPIATEPRPA